MRIPELFKRSLRIDGIHADVLIDDEDRLYGDEREHYAKPHDVSDEPRDDHGRWTDGGYNADDVAIANSTSRNSGAVGKNAVIPRVAREVVDGIASKRGTGKGSLKVLDFGAGKAAAHALAMRADGYDVTAYEFGGNVGGNHDPDAMKRQYDVVYASNVINVQNSQKMLESTLEQIAASTKPDGVAVMNLPQDPRKGAWSGKNADDFSTLQRELEKRFEKVERDGMVFRAESPKPKEGKDDRMNYSAAPLRERLERAKARYARKHDVSGEARDADGKWTEGGSVRRGKVGDMLAAGEVVTTASGRKTTPFPKLASDTNRKTAATVKRVDAWLHANAVAEAESRGDDFVLQQFKSENPAKMPPASKDSMEEYLFGGEPAEVPKPFTKPLAKTEPDPEPEQHWYGMTYRPPSLGAIPKGSYEHKSHPDFRHGQISYDRPLTGKEQSDFELTPIRNDSELPALARGVAERMGPYVAKYLAPGAEKLLKGFLNHGQAAKDLGHVDHEKVIAELRKQHSQPDESLKEKEKKQVADAIARGDIDSHPDYPELTAHATGEADDEQDGWSPENHVKIAADSIDKLRGQDVYRLLDSAPPEHMKKMAAHILKHRPELSDDIHDAAVDIEDERGGSESPQLPATPRKSPGSLFGDDGPDTSGHIPPVPAKARQTGLFSADDLAGQGQKHLFDAGPPSVKDKRSRTPQGSLFGPSTLEQIADEHTERSRGNAPMPKQKSMFSRARIADAVEQAVMRYSGWVTVGGSPGPNGKHEGGTPVQFGHDGTVTKGPAALKGAKLGGGKKLPPKAPDWFHGKASQFPPVGSKSAGAPDAKPPAKPIDRMKTVSKDLEKGDIPAQGQKEAAKAAKGTAKAFDSKMEQVSPTPTPEHHAIAAKVNAHMAKAKVVGISGKKLAAADTHDPFALLLDSFKAKFNESWEQVKAKTTKGHDKPGGGIDSNQNKKPPDTTASLPNEAARLFAPKAVKQPEPERATQEQIQAAGEDFTKKNNEYLAKHKKWLADYNQKEAEAKAAGKTMKELGYKFGTPL